MKKVTLSLVLLLTGLFNVFGQAIFDSAIHTAVPFGDVNSPAAESSQQVIDQDPMTKFLDFNAVDGIGFEVDLLGVAHTAVVMEVVTANDAPERDPVDFEIFGSNNGTDYTSITTGTIPCVADRFLSRTFSFVNTTSYTYYRLNFTGNCDPSSINQIADVQLYSVIGNAPSLTCPDDITLSNDPGQCGALFDFTIEGNDVEDGTIAATQTAGLPSGSEFPAGTTPVVYTATDSDGNIVSCGFTVMVEDTEDPIAQCPEDITVFVNPGETEAVVDYTMVPSDNCYTINHIDDFIPLGTISDQAYYLRDSFINPVDAFNEALIRGGFLGTIRNEEDNMFINKQVLERVGNLEVLIGYTDLFDEGNFIWQSEDPATYNNWSDGEPNDAGVNGEDYTTMRVNGEWNDVADDENPFPYVFEIPYEPIQLEGLPSGSAFPLGTTVNTFQVVDLDSNIVECSFNVIVQVSTGIEEAPFAKDISLSPNPVDDLVSIENNSDVLLDQVTLYSSDGRLIKTIEFIPSQEHLSIDLADILPGIYLVKIQGEQGMVMKKLVKR